GLRGQQAQEGTLSSGCSCSVSSPAVHGGDVETHRGHLFSHSTPLLSRLRTERGSRVAVVSGRGDTTAPVPGHDSPGDRASISRLASGAGGLPLTSFRGAALCKVGATPLRLHLCSAVASE